MNKLSISSLAWVILSTACISLEEIPIKPIAPPDGGFDAAQDVTPPSDAAQDVTPRSDAAQHIGSLPDAGRDAAVPFVDAAVPFVDAARTSPLWVDVVQTTDAQTPPPEALVADGGMPECNADGFCVVSRFRPSFGQTIESDGQDVYVFEGPSVDVLGNRGKDTRLWKVQGSSKSVLATGIALAGYLRPTGVSDGFVYWLNDSGGVTYRVSTSGGLLQQAPTPVFASGGVLWIVGASTLELRSTDGLELLSSTAVVNPFYGAACGDAFFYSEHVDDRHRLTVRSRSNPAVGVELGIGGMFNTMYCDPGHLYVPQVSFGFGREGEVEQYNAQTKERLVIARGFKHAIRNQWWYSLRQLQAPPSGNEYLGEGPVSVERWSTETPGDSLKLGDVDNAQTITATTSAVYVLDSAGKLFRKSVPQ